MISNWSRRIAAAIKHTKTPSSAEGPTFFSKSGTPKPRSFGSLASYRFIERHKLLARTIGINNPFFRTIERREGQSGLVIDGQSQLNFAFCDYLGLSTHPQVVQSSLAAIEEFGTCLSASRMVGGQFPLHRQLEAELAEFCGTEAALLFVSGHAANVSTIGTLMGEKDLVICDEFVHNSAVVGVRLSGATYRTFPHNNYEALDALLAELRPRYENVLIVVEGVYSTEGDLADLPRVVAIKERHAAWLMVDDAHGAGVLGATGRGCAEHWGVEPQKIDILMGTLSKTLASCGGYIAGSTTMIEILKYTAPGFVYSVGLLPSNTAAALAALRVIKAEPDRIQRLRRNCMLFLDESRGAGLNTGNSRGYGMIPIFVGSVSRTGRVVHRLSERGYNISFIIYPGVPINSGRLRFFITSEHTADEIVGTVQAVKEELGKFW